ncbi:hypothetical protein Dda_5843 [Drechslerella dactyloides]|uniref:HIT-type domain-containing protein n=1 Tax=Drechslerella dactyloides TaxID=74499 RepID=A0AAD6IUI8_DREDA|nr:hypothetical protein Dda_5843 [Drechslerella dactyloides]
MHRTPGTSGEDTGREQNHRMDRSSVCEVCYEAPARYRCPACSRRSCSLACSARHKARSSCPGRRLPSDYRPKPALADPQVLRADFSFLDSVQRSLQSSHDREEDDHERGAARARLAEACQARGVTVCPAPLPSSRARRNQSALVLASARGGQNATSTSTSTSTSTLPDAIANSNEHANADETTAGEQHISWTVDWLLDALPPVTSQLDERVPLQEAFRRDILPSLSLPSLPPNKELKEEEGEEEEFISIKGPARGHDGDTTAYAQEDDNKESTSTASYTFALRLVDDRAAQTSSLRPVSPSATLASALPGTSILEYPTILVSTIPSTTPNTSNTTSASLE